MYDLDVFFKNIDDDNKPYTGGLLSNPSIMNEPSINKHNIYIEVVAPRCIISNKPDRYEEYVKSIKVSDILFVGSLEDFENKYPELYL